MNHVLDILMDMDKKIEQEERALIHLNKQVGNKISKIKDLKDKRRKTAECLKNTLERNEVSISKIDVQEGLLNLNRELGEK